MGSAYRVTLDGTVDDAETTAWSHTWTDLPLYADGVLAQYTLREESVGEFNYSEVYDDGYRYYNVSYAPAVYTDADGATVPATSAERATDVQLTVTNERSLGAFAFTKVDDLDTPLPGATFRLYQPASIKVPTLGVDDLGGTVLLDGTTPVATYATAVSTSAGQVSFGRIPAGVYYLLEYKAPANYQASKTIYRIEFDGAEYSTAVWNNGAWELATTNHKVVNPRILTDVTLQKVDQDGVPLTGATFKLQKLTTTGVYADVAGSETPVDADGRIAYSQLVGGTYRIVETAAPGGYYRLSNPITFTLLNGVMTLDAPFGSWTVELQADGSYVLTVPNATGMLLPSTGGLGSLPFTVAGLALMAGSVLYMIVLRARREGMSAAHTQ